MSDTKDSAAEAPIIPDGPRLVHILTVASSLDFLRGQVRYVAGHGYDVHIVASPDREEMLSRFAATEGATAHPIRMTRTISPLTDAKSLFHLSKLLRRLAPDIVQTGTPKAGLLGILAAFVNRVPVRIYHMHGIRGLTAHGWRRAVLMATEWLTCRLSTRVLCVSQSARSTAISLRLCDPEKILVLGAGSCNGVDARGRFDPDKIDGNRRADIRRQLDLPAGGRVLGFVGRVVREKGIVELAAAWDELARQFPDLHLLIVGPWEVEDPLPQDALEALRDHPRVRIVAAVSDPSPYYAVMDVVTLPTYREGLPNVPLEAAAMELPVVATHVAGCVDAIVDGVTGTLVPPYAAGPLAEAIASYLRSPELCRQHGTRGRQRVLHDFVPEDVWRSVLRLYSSLR